MLCADRGIAPVEDCAQAIGAAPQRPPRRCVRRRRRVQLLPHEEPRRARRRRRRRDLERRDRRARAPPAAVRLGPQVRGDAARAGATRRLDELQAAVSAHAAARASTTTTARAAASSAATRRRSRPEPAALVARDGADYVAHLAVLLACRADECGRRARPCRHRDRRPLSDSRSPPAGVARRLPAASACRSASTRASTC